MQEEFRIVMLDIRIYCVSERRVYTGLQSDTQRLEAAGSWGGGPILCSSSFDFNGEET